MHILTPFLGIMVVLGLLIFMLVIDRLKLGMTLALIGAFFMVGPSLVAAQFGEAVTGGNLEALLLLASVGWPLFVIGVALAAIGWALAMIATTAGSPGAFGFMLLGYLGWPLSRRQQQLKNLYERGAELHRESVRVGG